MISRCSLNYSRNLNGEYLWYSVHFSSLISQTRRRKAEASVANANQENGGIYVDGIFLISEFGGEGGDYMPQPLGKKPKHKHVM